MRKTSHNPALNGWSVPINYVLYSNARCDCILSKRNSKHSNFPAYRRIYQGQQINRFLIHVLYFSLFVSCVVTSAKSASVSKLITEGRGSYEKSMKTAQWRPGAYDKQHSCQLSNTGFGGFCNDLYSRQAETAIMGLVTWLCCRSWREHPSNDEETISLNCWALRSCDHCYVWYFMNGTTLDSFGLVEELHHCQP